VPWNWPGIMPVDCGFCGIRAPGAFLYSSSRASISYRLAISDLSLFTFVAKLCRAACGSLLVRTALLSTHDWVTPTRAPISVMASSTRISRTNSGVTLSPGFARPHGKFGQFLLAICSRQRVGHLRFGSKRIRLHAARQPCQISRYLFASGAIAPTA